MKIDKKYKIEEAASSDKTRYAINCVRIDALNGSAKAIATDGKIMAIVPIELQDGDKSEVSLPCDAIKAARKAAGKVFAPQIKLNGHAVVEDGNGSRAFNYNEDRYPNFAQVIPKESKPDEVYNISFDVKLLTRLWKALGGEDCRQAIVKLKIRKDDHCPMEVSVGDGQGYGIIMPCRVG